MFSLLAGFRPNFRVDSAFSSGQRECGSSGSRPDEMVSRRTIAKIARESLVAAASTLSCFMAARSTHSADESQRSIKRGSDEAAQSGSTDLKIHQREV